MRLRLSDAVDIGEVPLSGQLMGLRLDDKHDLSTGCAWSQEEVLVCTQYVLLKLTI